MKETTGKSASAIKLLLIAICFKGILNGSKAEQFWSIPVGNLRLIAKTFALTINQFEVVGLALSAVTHTPLN